MEKADTLYINANIITMDAQNRRAQALAVSNGYISAIGRNEEIETLAGSQSKVIDVQGKTILPGFIDPHSHFLKAGMIYAHNVNLTSPPIGEIEDFDQLIEKLQKQAEKTEPGDWIIGFGYDDTLLKEKRHPTAKDLERVSNKHPILIRHISGHLVVANAIAMELASIDQNTPDPQGGHIRKDPGTGRPTGVFEEPPAFIPIEEKIPEPTEEEWQTGLAYASDLYVSKGVTTAQDGGVLPSFLPVYLAGHASGSLKNRVQILPRGASPLDGYPSHLAGVPVTEDLMLTMGAVKIWQDGSLQGYTGYLSNPYYKLLYDHEQGALFRGYPIYPKNDLIEMVCKWHVEGRQIAIHGNGDNAIEDILDAFEEAHKRYPRNDARHIIIHCQTAREDQLDRIKRLGVVPSFFTTHTFFWGDRHRDLFLGPTRASRINPCRSAMERNIIFTCHNDTYVTPIDPLLSVWSSANRITSSGKVLGEEQTVPVIEALRSVTSHAAYQFFEEDVKGSLEPGKLADMVVLDEDPLEIDKVKIKDIEILATIVGDKIVYGGF